MSALPSLVLLCKRPKLGQGKQRLTLTVGVEIARRVAEALLSCAIEDACNWPGWVIIAPASPDDYGWATVLARPVRSPVMILPQISGNLGYRINTLDQTLRHQGIDQLVYIGSDAPELVQSDYFAVCDALRYYDSVLLPAADGGVVLMASRYPWPELSGLPWSSDQLGAALVESCYKAGHTTKMLRLCSDIDDFADLKRLAKLLKMDERPARCALHKLVCDILSGMEITNADL